MGVKFPVKNKNGKPGVDVGIKTKYTKYHPIYKGHATNYRQIARIVFNEICKD